MLDPETKMKPDNLARDYGDMCLAADGFAQVRERECVFERGIGCVRERGCVCCVWVFGCYICLS